jgi:hypothetical protein
VAPEPSVLGGDYGTGDVGRYAGIREVVLLLTVLPARDPGFGAALQLNGGDGWCDEAVKDKQQEAEHVVSRHNREHPLPESYRDPARAWVL